MRKEDIELKKKLVAQFESSEKQFSSTIRQLSEDLNKRMSEGFKIDANDVSANARVLSSTQLLPRARKWDPVAKHNVQSEH